MGTRSITVIKDSQNNKIVEIYQQYDGYPSYLGKKLKEFIKSGELVNGFSSVNERQFNGIECFAAQLVAEFKTGTGGTYLFSPTTDYKNKKKYCEKYSAEYYYEIDHNLNLRCWDCYEDKEINMDTYKFKK